MNKINNINNINNVTDRLDSPVLSRQTIIDMEDMSFFTHGHVDHTGCGKWFVNNHNVKTYMSKIDDIYWAEHPTKPDRKETWKDYNINVYINDKDIILCGDKKIHVYSTPGHTPGCLSYIFPVKDNGEPHMAAIFGGVTPPHNKSDIQTYLDSLDYFIKEAYEKNVDVPLSNHTAIDNGLLRIAYSNKRYSYMPNIYVVGYDGFKKYSQVFKTLSYNILA